MRPTAGIVPVLLLAAACCAWAAQPDRVTGAIDNSQTVVLKGSVHPLAQPGRDQGPLDPSTELPYVSLLIQPSADQQAALKQLLAEQQDPSSPNYQKWLTPEQFGERFGLSHGDLTAITGWLRSEGFTIVEVARGRDWIAISGTVRPNTTHIPHADSPLQRGRRRTLRQRDGVVRSQGSGRHRGGCPRAQQLQNETDDCEEVRRHS